MLVGTVSTEALFDAGYITECAIPPSRRIAEKVQYGDVDAMGWGLLVAMESEYDDISDLIHLLVADTGTVATFLLESSTALN